MRSFHDRHSAYPGAEAQNAAQRGPHPSLTKNASIFRQIHLPQTAPRPGNALPVAGFACVLPCGLRLQAQPRCARRYSNERAARRVRRREVHLFTAVAPLQCIAGATSPRGFFESQRGAAGGPLARTPVRLKPCRQKKAFPGFLDVSYGSCEPEGKMGDDLFRLAALGTFRGPAGPFSL